MQFAQLAHRLLLWIGIAVAVGVALYAGFQGWLDWLWPGVQTWLVGFSKPLLDRFPNFETVDRLARVLGAIGTAMTAAFGVYTGLYYSKRSLPKRLRELLASADSRLLQDRAPLLAAISESRPGASADKSVFHIESLNRALGEIGFGKLDAADGSLRDALNQIREQRQTCDAQMTTMKKQEVTAHILCGAIASARAEANSRLGRPHDRDREIAEQEFTAALGIESHDLDALELRGRQRDLRGNDRGALADFEALEGAAQGVSLRAARACRCQAMVLEQRGTKSALTEARRRLERGLDTINAQGSLNEESWFERALLHQAYGSVQIKRKGLPSARQHLKDAINCFKNVKHEDARRHEAAAGAALAEITPREHGDVPKPSLLSQMLAWLRRLFD